MTKTLHRHGQRTRFGVAYCFVFCFVVFCGFVCGHLGSGAFLGESGIPPRPPASGTMPPPGVVPPPLRQRGASSSSHGPVGGLSVGTLNVRRQGFKHVFDQNLQMLAGETQLLCRQEIDNSFFQRSCGIKLILNTRTMSTRLSLGTGHAEFSWF